MSYKENELVKGIKRQDKEVFKYLYNHFFQRLFLYAKSYLDDDQESKDIVQELFYKLWEKNKKINFPTTVSAYLFRAVHNNCIQVLRHKTIEKKHNDHSRMKLLEAEIVYHNSTDHIFSSLNLQEIQEVFRRTLLQMPEKTREIFLLSRQLGNKNREIASNLNISIKTVEYHLSNALIFLKEHMKDYLLIFILSLFMN